MTALTSDDTTAAPFAGLSLDMSALTGAAVEAPAATEVPPAPAAIVVGGAIAISELLSLTESLTEAMEAETDALRSMDMARFSEVSQRKIGLANNYANVMWQLHKSPDALRRLPQQLRDTLRAATERMQVATRDNESAVRGAHEASRLLMNAIAKAAQSRRPTATTYGANGRAGAAASATGRQSSAIFQDTRL